MPKIGNVIQCDICGKDIVVDNSRRVRCRDKCTPTDGRKFKCSECGEYKGYYEFYDQRGKSGKVFKKKCKQCCRDQRKSYFVSATKDLEPRFCDICKTEFKPVSHLNTICPSKECKRKYQADYKADYRIKYG